jgi:hypothetical protein
MPGRTSGLERDLNLVRRRAWLFIPFFLFGLMVAFALGSFAGSSNAVATMQLETIVHELLVGGDRGLRVFEAQSMTQDEAFKKKVLDAIGDPNFDYARFTLTLSPVTVGDGVASGILTLSVKDADRAKAQKYRDAFVAVFTKEYTAQDGIFRTRFVEKRQVVADQAEADYQAAYKKLKDLAAQKNVTAPLDQVSLFKRENGIVAELAKQEGSLQGQLADVQGAIRTIQAGKYSTAAGNALAASVLKTAVSGDGSEALAAREAALTDSIGRLQKQRAAYSDGSFDPEFLKALDNVRGLDQLKLDSYERLGNAKAAVTSAESTIETSLSFSGGLAGSLLGKIAVTLAVTIVFGLIAIYAFEWLSQVRAGVRE